jgi:beta-N-acetylhexosaminidase
VAGSSGRRRRREQAGRAALAGLAVVALGLGAGCSSARSPHSPTSQRPSASASASPRPSASQQPPPSPAAAAAESVQGPAATPTNVQLADLGIQAGEISRLSPEQMAGQRVIYSYNGLTPPPDLVSAISDGEVGGVIFFGFNIASAAQLQGVIGQLNAANASPGNPARDYPLLLMTDQEGGLVRRLQWAGPVQSEAQIGSAANPAAAASAAGSQAAEGLHSVGINVDLAPVLDVYRQPGDFDDQYQRSYSSNPSVATAAGAAFVRAVQAGGVAATVKHFPGLGPASAAENTDNGPVTVSVPAATLRSVDEAPYQPAIQAGSRLAMVSWANYPSLDPRLPAGLSPTIVRGELQGRLGFDGVTITDALGAGALGVYGSLENRTMLAARAGMDALLCTATMPLPGPQCVAGLAGGFTDGALPPVAFKAQLAQLLELRASLAG